mgnify:CR=1 FL=1
MGLGPGVDEVAAFSVHAVAFVEEDSAFFGLVLGVELLVFAQFVRPVGELALLLVGAHSELEVLFAELGLLLILPYGRFWQDCFREAAGRGRVFGGGRVVGVFGGVGLGVFGEGQLQTSSQHISTLIELIFND